MRNDISFVVLFLSCFSVFACGGNNSKASSSAKKVAPKSPKKLTQMPPGASPVGTQSEVSPPTGGPSLGVPGGQAEVVEWQDQIDDSGQQADCLGAFADNGSAAIACAPLISTCEDGSDLEAALLVAFDGSSNQGAFAVVGSDLCGSGVDAIGCTFSGDGSIGSCGAADISGDHIDISE